MLKSDKKNEDKSLSDDKEVLQKNKSQEKEQTPVKEETIEVTYSYWDGSGHRKSVNMKKGHTIYQFF